MEILNNIITAFEQTLWLERLAFVCGIIQVILSKNNKISNYLFGILGILASMYLMFGKKLYADMILNMYYLIMSVYGWWYWNKFSVSEQKPITTATHKEWYTVLSICMGGVIIFYVFLTQITDSDVPIWDSWVSATAWAGMWLMARRKLENWILLNISNLFAIPLLIHKELYLIAALTIFLFIIAILGYFKWKKLMQSQTISYVK